MTRILAASVLLGGLCLAGCENAGSPSSAGQSGSATTPQNTAINTTTTTSTGQGQVNSVGIKKSRDITWQESDNPAPGSSVFPSIKEGSFGGGGFTTQGATVPGRSVGAAVKQIGDAITESREYGPTLAVWMFDQSDSAAGMVGQAQMAIKEFYQGAGAKAAGKPLSTAIVGFGSQVTYALEEPSTDTTQVVSALDEVKQASGGREATFGAIHAVLDKYSDYRSSKRYEVMIILVTDEAGDDADMADQVVATAKQAQLPIYIIGVPAPFGRKAGLKGPIESDSSIAQGPETLYPTRINLGFMGDSYGLDLIDSGFGPYQLERLCRASGGAYLSLRPEGGGGGFRSSFGTQWPSAGAMRFPANAMRKYQPEYKSEAEFKAQVEANGCLKALVDASKLPAADTLTYAPTNFQKKSEAEMAVDLSNAQKAAARVEPGVNSLYKVLQLGEKDRDSLTNPRWQASYDLAMGRVCAAKTRVEGYNAMLASLKRGKSFTKESSTSWALQPVDPSAMVEASSSLKKLGEKARMYLERVVKEHKDTPWAMIAERELSSPGTRMPTSFGGAMEQKNTGKNFLIGWNWVEQ